jgi:hypothetical protein
MLRACENLGCQEYGYSRRDSKFRVATVVNLGYVSSKPLETIFLLLEKDLCARAAIATESTMPVRSRRRLKCVRHSRAI